MNKLDNKLKSYLAFLILSWVIIIYYMVYHLDHNQVSEEQIKNELKSFPHNHSQITDSTLKNAK